MMWPFSLLRSKSADADIQAFIAKAFGFKVRDTTLYEQALRHSSAATKIKPGLKNSNERLEFLGDAIIDAVVAHYLYVKYPGIPEGELTKMKSKVVRRENLNMVGHILGVREMLKRNLGRQEMHDSMIGNAFEALVGAIYLDRGYNFTRDILLKLLKQHGLDTKVHDDIDYKSKLHEWCQKNKQTIDFFIIEHRNEGGSSYYKVGVRIDEQLMGEGDGNSKKIAEQKAARAAVKALYIKD
ncbi:MAG: ribonuclease III [Flavobacteriales bacterium]